MLALRFSGVLVLLACLAISTAAQETGEQLFSSHCASCHGLDGRGGEHAPNIATEPKVQNLSERDLMRMVHDGIPAAGMPGFASVLTSDQTRGLVGYLRVLQGKVKTSSVSGDAEHGRSLFFGAAGCSGCHMVAGTGGFLAADLSSYSSTHTPDAIREAIINPNKNLDPRHGTVVVVVRGGNRLTGLVRNEDNFTLEMQTADGNFHFFEKSALKSVEHPAQSLMPLDYGSRLGKKDMDDLITFLVNASGSQPVSPKSDDEDE